MSGDPSKPIRKTEKSPVSSPKKLSLSQQLDEQQKLINELTERIHQKEQELSNLNAQTHLIDDLTKRLQHAEASMQASTGQSQEKGQPILTAKEQAHLIDDLSEKIQEMEIKLVYSSLHSKHTAAQNIVKTHMIAGMSLGLLPAPLFDIVALSGTQLNLLRSLSLHYGVDFDKETSKAVLTSLVSGSLPVLTVLGLSSIAKLIPGIGTIGGGISMTALAGSTIYSTGQVFIHHFEAGGTLLDFDGKHWQTFFKQKLDEGKAFIKNKIDNKTG